MLAAHDTISGIYRHALQISAREDADPLRLSFHCDAITSEALPLLEAIGNDPAVIDSHSGDWLIAATTALALVAKRLQRFRASLGHR